MTPKVDRSKCRLCEGCIDVCDHEVFTMQASKIIIDRAHKCTGCCKCTEACENNAIVIEGRI